MKLNNIMYNLHQPAIFTLYLLDTHSRFPVLGLSPGPALCIYSTTSVADLKSNLYTRMFTEITQVGSENLRLSVSILNPLITYSVIINILATSVSCENVDTYT